MGMLITKRPSATPPRDRPPLPRKEILPDELPLIQKLLQSQKKKKKHSETQNLLKNKSQWKIR